MPPSDAAAAVEIRQLSYRYGERTALDDIELTISPGDIFGLLGPNGSGKTTLFRILCTLLPLQEGTVVLLGADVSTAAAEVRQRLGITFQSPSLDGKLSVFENLKHQSHLYGLSGRVMRGRIDELLERFKLAERRNDIVDELSGGLKRRVELAKGLLHQPQLLLLDEPSTGLDPGARSDLWHQLRQLREEGITVLLTTHLMEEAAGCDRIAILDRGRLVADGEPEALRSELGGDGVTIHARNPDVLAQRIIEHFELTPRRLGASLRVELEDDRDLLGELMETFSADIRSIEFGKPTLEDVFVAKTGHAFHDEERDARVADSDHISVN